MKNLKKVLALALALCMVLGFAACGKDDEDYTGKELDKMPEVDLAAYQEESATVYNNALSEYASAYATALAETKNVSLRYALMAIAEAKLMESAVYLPGTSQGGNYAIGYTAPYTTSTALWGVDADRYYTALVVDGTTPLTSEQRTEMKAKYAELKGQGTYYEWAKQYLADQGYTLKDTYGIGYSSDPQTWDLFNTYRSADTEAIINTVDFLMEYDNEGNQIPKLAESYTVSEDGTVYTFKIREGVSWTDYQGREVGKVTADSFVAGMQHLLDAAGGLEYLAGELGSNILNADAYVAGECDFSEVGVKAVDEYTLEYTLAEANPFFLTTLSYNPMGPLCREYYESQGGKFGDEFDADAEDYNYGKDPEHIAYCGVYLVTSYVPENSIVFEMTPNYYDAENVAIKTIKWYFNDGTDALKSYNDMKAGLIAGAGLNASALEAAKADGYFDKYMYISGTDATSYGTFMNINRQSYANLNSADGAYVAESTKDYAAADRAKKALANQNFRLALAYSLDRGSYNAQSVGEDLKYVSLINSYTPGNFVFLTEDVTVTIGKSEVTFEAGTYYGEIMQAQIDADGYPITVWDPEGNDGLGSSAGFDGWYNEEAAVEALETAIKELNITIDEENPIYIDLPAYTGSTTYINRATAYKQSVEKVLGGKVIINLTECPKAMDWYYAGYYCDYGYQCNYDLYDVSGWGPDYGDPQTYLNTLNGAEGDMIHCLGIY